MIAYKLLKQRKDGSLGPLFINAKAKLPIGEWMVAEDHPTKGYAYRPGWHCLPTPDAPHLSKNPKNGPKRVWCRVKVTGVQVERRPDSQGGVWFLCDRMQIIEVIG